MVTSAQIKNLARDHGFDICGVTSAAPILQNRGYFDEWISKGYGEPLEYMSRYYDLRFDPSQLLDGGVGRSVVVCGVNYKNRYSLECGDPQTPRVASYALNRDYHKTIRKQLKAILRDLQREHPSLQGRCFTDSAPLLEKQLAVDAGLGWIGRQSLLITPQYGSFVLLGEIVINDEVDCYDTPLRGRGCGDCRKCVDTCPVSAINDNRTIDARRCISCRTVEVDDNSPLPLNGWIFGCDECQSCCPHNQLTPLHLNEQFTPIVSPLSRDEWQALCEAEFLDKFGSTPLKRAGLGRIRGILERLR